MRCTLKKFHNAKGLTLVELLVAVAIGLILLGGIYQVFVSSTSAYSRNENMSRLQENSRFSVQTLKDNIVGAGFLGCSQDPARFESILNSSSDFEINYAVPIEGLEWSTVGSQWQDRAGLAVGPESIPGFNLTAPVPGSDILVIRNVTEVPAIDVLVDMGAPDDPINVGGGQAIAAGSTLIVADCETSTMFNVQSYVGGLIDHDGANATADLRNPALYPRGYLAGSQIYFPRTIAFYVRNNPAGVPSLYRRVTGAADPEEIIEGVEMMQVLYGVDTDNDRTADDYVAANAVGNWNEVLSVRIGLLLQAPNINLRAAAVNRVYNVNGVDVNRNDQRSRTVVNMTIGLRNRLR